jgi:hypothetical protein
METHKQYAKIRIAIAPDIIGPWPPDIAELLSHCKAETGQVYLPKRLNGWV